MLEFGEIFGIAIFIFSVPWLIILSYLLTKLIPWKEHQKDYSYKPLTSFVIAAWKEKKRLQNAINSILRQNYPKNKMEIVIVGGGDRDTISIAKTMQRKNSVKFLEEKVRAGKWKALNRGVRAARGEVIAFTDADCELSRNWLKNMNANLADKKISGVVGNVIAAGKGYISRAMSGFFPLYTLSTLLIGAPFYLGQSSVFRSKLLRKIKFRDSMVEDMVLSSEFQAAKLKIVYEKNAIVAHKYPIQISGFFNATKRLYVGSYRSLMRNPFVAFNFFMTLIGIVIGFLILIFHSSLTINIPLFVISITLPVTTAIYFLKKFGKTIKFIPEMALILILYGAVNLVSVVYYILGKKVTWEIYKK